MPSAEALHTSLASAQTCLDDLQAEIEAGMRCVKRIHADARSIDGSALTRQEHAERLSTLRRCATDLRVSIAQQRGILRDLRRSIDGMRRALSQRK